MKFILPFIVTISCILLIRSDSVTSNAAAGTCAIKPEYAKINGLVSKEVLESHPAPFIDGSKLFINGEIVDWNGVSDDVTSPIVDASTGERIVVGRLARMSGDDSLKVLENSKKAWNNGQGVWPQMTMEERISAIERVVNSLKQKREKIVNTLLWEICKSSNDAAAEFDRTIIFIEETIKAYRNIDGVEGAWKTVSGIMARVRRAAIGIMLALGPCEFCKDCIIYL